MRIAQIITISEPQRKTLEQWARGRSTPARLVLRAQIILLAATGMTNKDIALKLGTNRLLVGKWRSRFAAGGLAGIEKDAPRGGRPPASRDAITARIIEWTTQKKPGNATHWSCRTLAEELGTSHAMVNRVWRANNLKPHTHQQFVAESGGKMVPGKITDRRIRRGVFHSVPELIDAIMAYIQTHNENPRSFEWTAKAETIIEKVRPAREVLNKIASI